MATRRDAVDEHGWRRADCPDEKQMAHLDETHGYSNEKCIVKSFVPSCFETRHGCKALRPPRSSTSPFVFLPACLIMIILKDSLSCYASVL